MANISNPYGAILMIADGSSFAEISSQIECRPGSEPSWTQAIGGVFALLSSEKLIINKTSKNRIREELEKLDRFIDLQATQQHRFEFSESLSQEPSQ